MKETLCEAENRTNRFNVEAFPAHSLEFSCISGSCSCDCFPSLATFSIYFKQKNYLPTF